MCHREMGADYTDSPQVVGLLDSDVAWFYVLLTTYCSLYKAILLQQITNNMKQYWTMDKHSQPRLRWLHTIEIEGFCQHCQGTLSNTGSSGRLSANLKMCTAIQLDVEHCSIAPENHRKSRMCPTMFNCSTPLFQPESAEFFFGQGTHNTHNPQNAQKAKSANVPSSSQQNQFHLGAPPVLHGFA